MKPSRYNYSIILPDGRSLFFNFYTLNLIVLHGEESVLAHKILKNPGGSLIGTQESKLKNLFVEKGFIIDDEINEVELLKESHQKSCEDTKNLSLTIVPTLACNFRCTYCYQTGNFQTMSKKIENVLVHFVEDKIQKGGSLSVTWFGGEPLLKLDIIERLTNASMHICNSNDVDYSASMITNGYLLNKENIERLVKIKVKKVQVTLDGPSYIHDKRRITKGGGKTFQKIFNNIKRAHKKIAISLRMNVDQNNKDKIDDMLDILEKQGLEKSIGFYPGHILPYTSVCSDVAGFCLSDEEFSLLGLETLMKMTKRGFTSTFNFPKSTDYHCMADNDNAFAITPSGGITKCWNEVDNPDAEIGHLLKPFTDKMKKNLERWRSRNPFELECKECKLLPICMGGCPYQFLHSGKLDCHSWKPHLDESLLFYYYLKKVEQEGEIIQQFHKAVKSVKELATATKQKI